MLKAETGSQLPHPQVSQLPRVRRLGNGWSSMIHSSLSMAYGRHHNSFPDLSTSFRYSNLSNFAKLELVKLDRPRSEGM